MLKQFIPLVAIPLLISGCAVGPMQRHSYGPMETPVFDAIAVSKAEKPKQSVLFKEYTLMYEDEWNGTWGIFTITDKSILFLRWSVNLYDYEVLFRLDHCKVAATDLKTIHRQFFPDSQVMTIKDINGHESTFSLNGRTAAQNIIADLRPKQAE